MKYDNEWYLYQIVIQIYARWFLTMHWVKWKWQPVIWRPRAKSSFLIILNSYPGCLNTCLLLWIISLSSLSDVRIRSLSITCNISFDLASYSSILFHHCSTSTWMLSQSRASGTWSWDTSRCIDRLCWLSCWSRIDVIHFYW